MVNLEPYAYSILRQRSLGLFNHTSLKLNQDDLLLNGLNIEHKLSLREQTPVHLKELISTSEQLLGISARGSIEFYILSVALAQLFYLSHKNNDVVNLLKGLEIPVIEDLEYFNSLKYKKWYLLAVSYKALGKSDEFKESVISGLNSSSHIPLDTHIESRDWLHLLYQEYKTFSSGSLSELTSVFHYQNFVLSYANHYSKLFSTKEKDLTAFINSRAENLLSSTKFPTSNEKNNYELEEFINEVSKTNFYKPIDLIDKGISKTYQSITLIGNYTTTRVKAGGDIDEIKASFDVYLEYVHSYYVLNDRKYYDILSTLKVFQEFFNYSLNSDGFRLVNQDYKYYLTKLDKFKNLLNEFYETYEIKQIRDYESIENADYSDVSQSLRIELSDIWFSIANSVFSIYQNPNLILSQNINSIEESLTFYSNSISLNISNINSLFNYTRTLALLRNYKKSYQYLKALLKKLERFSLVYFRAWHLYALILSIEENKDESFKVISFLINEIEEFISLNKIQINHLYKKHLIEIKITQLAIIESFYGLEQTLEVIPELFTLFNELFENSSQIQQIAQEPLTEPKQHRRSLSTTRTLTRIKTITKSHKNVPISKTTKISNSNSKLSITEQKILQKIWLVTAQIYFKSSLTAEAEQAIVEAENSYEQTADSHSALAILTSNVRPQLSLSEFENALNLDDSSIVAIVGFSNLILNSDKDSAIFVDSKDRLAGCARAKLLLETVVETFSGGYKSEIWWLLSKIYETTGDRKRLDQSLWKCIQLEESRAVREFENV